MGGTAGQTTEATNGARDSRSWQGHFLDPQYSSFRRDWIGRGQKVSRLLQQQQLRTVPVDYHEHGVGLLSRQICRQSDRHGRRPYYIFGKGKGRGNA